MIKRVNFTGRKRIFRERIAIEVMDGSPRTFQAAINLNDLKFPEDAAVVLEATCAGSSLVQRYEYGTVKAMRVPANRQLRDLEGEHVYFTLKVIDRSERIGRLLGIAEHIRPERVGQQTAAGRQGILPIDVREMGQELWQLDTSGRDAILFVNKSLPELKERARFDPYFYALVYPEVVRRLLTKAIENGGNVDDEDEDWKTLWLRFGQNLHPTHDAPPDRSLVEDVEDWIDDVVEAFCNSHTMRDKFAAELTRREGAEA